MKRKGFLIVNGFLQGGKYDEVYSFLTAAFKKHDCDLTIKRNVEFLQITGNKPVIDKNEADFVVFWDKDFYLAKRIEDCGIRVFNSSAAIRDCDNKILSAVKFEKAGINTPETIIAPKTFENIGYTDLDFLKAAGDVLGFPMVIKEAYGSFGQQVYLAKDLEAAEDIVRKIGGKEFLMQKFVKESCGRDLRINVVKNKVVASMLRENKNDFRSNVTGGGVARRTVITKEQESAAISALNALSCDFGGVDVLLNDGEPMVLEVNSNMHFVSTFNCTGINVAESIAEHIVREIYG